MKRILRWSMCAVLAGCGSDDGGPSASDVLDDLSPAAGLDTEATAHAWADTASAPNVYAISTALVFVAELAIQSGATCPTVTEEGTTSTYNGGCTDGNGNEWFGRVVVTESTGTDAGTIRYDGFGATGTEDCMGVERPTELRIDGTVVQRPDASGVEFDVDVVFTGKGPNEIDCAEQALSGAIEYSGATTMGSTTDRSTWRGSGRVGADLTGVADVETSAELIDRTVCEHEALSGTTTVRGTNTLVITYDGETDCDVESTVQWSVDGTAKGELTGIACAVAPGAASRVGGAVFLLAFVALVGLRRRR